MAVEINEKGILEYSPLIDYEQGAMIQSGVKIVRATVPNGPGTGGCCAGLMPVRWCGRWLRA